LGKKESLLLIPEQKRSKDKDETEEKKIKRGPFLLISPYRLPRGNVEMQASQPRTTPQMV